MKKIFGGLGLCLVVLLILGVFVAAANLTISDGTRGAVGTLTDS